MSEPGERDGVESVVANRCVTRVGARAPIVALDVVETERQQHRRCRGSSLVLAGRAALSARDVAATNLRRIQDLPSSPREHLEPAGEAPGLPAKPGLLADAHAPAGRLCPPIAGSLIRHRPRLSQQGSATNGSLADPLGGESQDHAHRRSLLPGRIRRRYRAWRLPAPAAIAIVAKHSRAPDGRADRVVAIRSSRPVPTIALDKCDRAAAGAGPRNGAIGLGGAAGLSGGSSHVSLASTSVLIARSSGLGACSQHCWLRDERR